MARAFGPASLHRIASVPPRGRGVVLPAYHPAARSGRSIFPSRVFEPGELARVLKDGHQSRKIGKVVMKGQRRGWPIFTLTLEERASCPSNCTEWASCYGNNMQAAERVEHGAALIRALEQEVIDLAKRYPRGFMVRLHILGDFWSADYVAFWHRMLIEHRALHLFGFTAQPPSGPIGRAIEAMVIHQGWGRATIRWSGAPYAARASRVLEAGETDPDAILCPAQTGATDCCATCALCWHSERSIAFKRH